MACRRPVRLVLLLTCAIRHCGDAECNADTSTRSVHKELQPNQVLGKVQAMIVSFFMLSSCLTGDEYLGRDWLKKKFSEGV